ncbi:MAG: MBL fold metallo-hydrolase [Dehalococcoidia bacterium]|nr:MBL fold metallo-hydrolase [Dehalococcoidia bacterium]
MVSVRWTGAAGLEFTHNGQTILIDPYHSRLGKLKVFFGRLTPDIRAIEGYSEKLPGNLSAIIVGHTHFDHALDIPEFSKHLDGPLVGSLSLENLMARHGMPSRVTVCEGSKRIDLPGNAALTMIPSMHGLAVFGITLSGDIDPSGQCPLRFSQYRHGAVYMPKLEMGGKTFMHAGSANFIESELGGHHCDVLFMCVSGWKKNPAYTTSFLEILKPKIIVPIHFDDFTAPLRPGLKPPTMPFVDLDGFLKSLRQSAPDIEIRVSQLFETMTF